MKTEILPQESSRAEAFSLWMSSPMPMVTLVKTMNVTPLLKMRKKSGIKFTALMCWCIGRAASRIEEFYLLPEEGKLFRYDKLVINVIVGNKQGGINFCDVLFRMIWSNSAGTIWSLPKGQRWNVKAVLSKIA